MMKLVTAKTFEALEKDLKDKISAVEQKAIAVYNAENENQDKITAMEEKLNKAIEKAEAQANIANITLKEARQMQREALAQKPEVIYSTIKTYTPKDKEFPDYVQAMAGHADSPHIRFWLSWWKERLMADSKLKTGEEMQQLSGQTWLITQLFIELRSFKDEWKKLSAK